MLSGRAQQRVAGFNLHLVLVEEWAKVQGTVTWIAFGEVEGTYPPVETDYSRVLGVLETMAFAAESKSVPFDLFWTTLGDTVSIYYEAFKWQIRRKQETDPTYWETLDKVAVRLAAENRKRGSKWPGGFPPREVVVAELERMSAKVTAVDDEPAGG